MRKLVIALALTTTTLATPAGARDGSPYVGVEGGILRMENHDWDYSDPTLTVSKAFEIGHKRGYDIDLIAGYDLGLLRVEGEAAYKRATVDDAQVNPAISDSIGATVDSFNADGRSSAFSAMLNGLIDIGGDDSRFSGYLGGGVGVARVRDRIILPNIDRAFTGRDSGFAYQAIAGVRYAATQNVDVGLKYRFFTVPDVRYTVDSPSFTVDGGNWRSHSLLASLVYNFVAPAVVVAPPPVIVEQAPPPPPATQTCPDGSVILATAVCPPPPPPPPGERG